MEQAINPRHDMENLFAKAKRVKENIGSLFKPDPRPSYEKPFLRRAADLFQPTLVSSIPGDPASRTFKEKADDLIWVSPKDLPEKTVPPVRIALEAIEQKKFYSTFGF